LILLPKIYKHYAGQKEAGSLAGQPVIASQAHIYTYFPFVMKP